MTGLVAAPVLPRPRRLTPFGYVEIEVLRTAVIARSRRTGRPYWHVELGQPIFGAPVLSAGVLVLGLAEGAAAISLERGVVIGITRQGSGAVRSDGRWFWVGGKRLDRDPRLWPLERD